MSFDHILMIGFGGPPRPEDVKPFLKGIARGARIPGTRLAEVVHHYEAVGGFSRYTEQTLRLVAALEQDLRASGVMLPVCVGMRNWHPFLKEAAIRRRGRRARAPEHRRSRAYPRAATPFPLPLDSSQSGTLGDGRTAGSMPTRFSTAARPHPCSLVG